MQKTVEKELSLVGTGIHLGKPVRINIKPAPPNHGIVFKRLDVIEKKSLIKTTYANIFSSELCSTLINNYGISVKTVEHLLAAFSGVGISNALIEIDNEEIPILDGSSIKFVNSLLEAGVRNQNNPKNFCFIKKTIEVTNNNGWVKMEPANELILTVVIDYPKTCIGKQKFSLTISPESFLSELSNNRTFCLKKDINGMRKRGFALGGNLDNAIVVDGYKILNPNGLRRKDEFVRHKMLDALGDLSLAGFPLIGHYMSFCGGHRLNNQLIRDIFSDKTNYKISQFYNKKPNNYINTEFNMQNQSYRAVS